MGVGGWPFFILVLGSASENPSTPRPWILINRNYEIREWMSIRAPTLKMFTYPINPTRTRFFWPHTTYESFIQGLLKSVLRFHHALNSAIHAHAKHTPTKWSETHLKIKEHICTNEKFEFNINSCFQHYICISIVYMNMLLIKIYRLKFVLNLKANTIICIN